MQIQLLIPGLLWPTATLLGPAAGLALDGLATLLGRGTRSMHGFEPYDRQLARLFGLEGSALPLAALRRLGEAGPQPPADDGHWLCADPVNLSFAREHLLLQAFDDDQLPAEESAELVAALTESFTDLGRFEAYFERVQAGASRCKAAGKSHAYALIFQPDAAATTAQQAVEIKGRASAVNKDALSVPDAGGGIEVAGVCGKPVAPVSGDHKPPRTFVKLGVVQFKTRKVKPVGSLTDQHGIKAAFAHGAAQLFTAASKNFCHKKLLLAAYSAHALLKS